MLLNPGRAEGPEVDTARSSGGFTGLVRHVIELSAVGELPVALDAEPIGEGSGDEPVGCSIEYSLPSGQVRRVGAGIVANYDRLALPRGGEIEVDHHLKLLCL